MKHGPRKTGEGAEEEGLGLRKQRRMTWRQEYNSRQLDLEND